jgi:hypothetical protein
MVFIGDEGDEEAVWAVSKEGGDERRSGVFVLILCSCNLIDAVVGLGCVRG